MSRNLTCDIVRSTDFGHPSTGIDLGLFFQNDDDDRQWSITNVSTPTPLTGPSSDHTGGGGYYAFLEATGATLGDRVSPRKY